MIGKYMTIPVKLPRVMDVLNTEASPKRQLIAAVVLQAIEDMATYPSRQMKQSSDQRVRSYLKVITREREDAENFFLSERCMKWLPHITPNSREPEEIRRLIIDAEIERRQRRQSAMDGTRQWTHEADRLREVKVAA